MNTETQDASNRDGWSAWARSQSRGALAPRLRLLYHCDLDRIGALSMPGAVASRWLVVGRHDPPFGGLGGATLPLDDPRVSREQLRIRYHDDTQRFEIEPIPVARRPVGLVDLEAASADHPATTPITGPTLLPPGACIAIGDRILIGLELARVHATDASRLGLVGESEAMWALRDEIQSVAQFGRSALVSGPTGAGKELVARALHQVSPRKAGPFIPVNCAALPETLVESVLFGHKKGAFTGADAEEKGLFRAADGGTLFLDELGELPIAVQPKLLRVLQDGVVVPVGAHEGRRVDVRAVAATHRDLESQVRAGGLREDLYHRLAAHVLRVPALSQRRFDIPELFVHLLRRLRAEHGSLEWLWDSGRKWQSALPIGFIADLMRRPWRGNVRELQNLVERTARRNLHPGPFQAPEAASHDNTPVRASEPPSAAEPAASEQSDDVPSRNTRSRPSAETAVPEALLRTAGEALGLAHKTVLKLLAPETLLSLDAESERLDETERTRKLRARAAEALLLLLEARDFNQSSVAADLGTSRTTLIKLMDDLGLPRATDLGADEIARARAQAGGDLDGAARLLRVSPIALKKRLTLLNLKSRG
ncbi:Response regulator of zinc sigma-54-dependent two-component system [Minicystis rosea]|nr:Response regulator of zinc sigma-54-dependent two-component system [Minicystis rosea]